MPASDIVDTASGGRSGGPGVETGKAASVGARQRSGDNGGPHDGDDVAVASVSDKSGETESGTGTGIGTGSSSSYSAFVGALESVVSSMGSSSGGVGVGVGGGLRSRLGTGTTPSLYLDEEDDDDYGLRGGGVDVTNGTFAAAAPSPSFKDSSSHRPQTPIMGADGGGSGGDGGGSVSSDAAADEGRRRSSAAEASGGSDGGGKEPTAARGSFGAVVCLRCRGTVEGPQHSTCTCEVRVWSWRYASIYPPHGTASLGFVFSDTS